jgi:hypothetical protein
MTTDADQLGTVQCILHATDHDVAEFLGFFDQDTVFQMGNSGPVVGRDAITQWVGGYLASVTGTCGGFGPPQGESAAGRPTIRRAKRASRPCRVRPLLPRGLPRGLSRTGTRSWYLHQ